MDSNTINTISPETTCSPVLTASEYHSKLLSQVTPSKSSLEKHYQQPQQQQHQQHQQQQQQQFSQEQHNDPKDLQEYQQQGERQQRDQQGLFVPQFPCHQQQHDCRDAAFSEQQFPNVYQQKEQNAQQNLEVHRQIKELHQQEKEGHKHKDQHQQQSLQHEQQQLQTLHEEQLQQQSQHQLVKGETREQQDTEEAQHCALEILTSISQHVSNAAVDFYMANRDSHEFAANSRGPQAFKSDHKPISSVHSSIGEEPVMYSQVMAHLHVPVSVNEGTKPVSDCFPAPAARKGQETILYHIEDESQNSKHEVQETNTDKATENQHMQMIKNMHVHFSEDAELETAEEVAPALKTIPVPTFSKDFIKSPEGTGIENVRSSQYSESQENKQADADDEINGELEDKDKAIGEEEEDIKDKDEYVCLCKEDFLNYARRKVKKYMCGGCLDKFISICHLHKHLESHGSGGSYHFDHVSQTAYPKYDTFCSFTQTDNDEFVRQDESFVIEDINSSDELKNSNRPDVESVNEAEIREQKFQATRKSRKRKQDNPKPTKPRVSDQRKNERSSKKGRRKSEVKDKIKPDYFIAFEGIEGYQRDSHAVHESAVGLIETEESFNMSSSSAVVHDSKEKQDNDCIVVKQEVIDESEKPSVIKPLKKRGRPRKSENSNEKNSVKRRKVVEKDEKAKNQELIDENYNGNNYQENSAPGVDIPVIMVDTFERSNLDVYQKRHSDLTVKPKVRKNAAKEQMCDVCGLPVPKYNHVYHMRRHTGEKPFVCDKCGKAFAHRRFLAKHLLTHAEDKPWKCDLCSAQFCQKSEYSMHMNAHQGNRPHECRVCGMKFLSKAMLNTHQANVHMGITRFECEVCNRRFFKRSSLNVHQATHFEATMKCSFCDRMFKDRAGLKRHERIHTGEKRFRCHVCNHEFIQSTPYWVHMEKRHQMDRESVKNMLKGIRESNKRVGIRTEINVLPTDVDHLLVAQEKADTKKSKSTNVAKKNSSRRSDEKSQSTNSAPGANNFLQIPAVEQLNNGENIGPQKLYTDIKVPNIYSSSLPDLVTPNPFTSVDNNEPLTLQQHFRYIVPSQDPVIVQSTTCGPGSTSSQEAPAASSQSLGLPPNLPISVSLASLGIPVNSLNHGFIGLNPLQQALDYSSSLPNTGTYTDISSDRVTNQQQ